VERFQNNVVKMDVNQDILDFMNNAKMVLYLNYKQSIVKHYVNKKVVFYLKLVFSMIINVATKQHF
jgi:hypothetical protein